MKITHIIPALTKGGAEKVVVDLVNESYLNGHEVKLVLFYPADKNLRQFELLKDIEVFYISPKKNSFLIILFKSVFWLFGNWKWIKNQEIIHAHLTLASILATFINFIRFLTFKRGPKIVETNHSIGIPIKLWQNILFSMLSKWRDGYIIIGNDEFWEKKFSHKQHTVLAIIPNGTKFKENRVLQTDKDTFLSNAVIPKNSLLIGTVSRIVKERSPLSILEIFKNIENLLSDQKNVHFMIGGDGDMMDAVKQKSIDLHLNSKLSLPGLIIDPSIARSSMVLYVSINVGAITGIAGIEAASEGIPVISLQMQPNYISTEDDWVWSHSNPYEVAKESVSLLLDDNKRQNLILKQQKYVLENLTSNKMAKEYEKLYSSLLT
jgi:glycosyltransferase involved in cell wall biosynthesis